MRVEGSWSLPKGVVPPDRLEGRFIGGGAGRAQEGRRADAPSPPSAASDWRPFPYQPGARGFRALVPLAAGGWYRLQVRLVRGGTELAATEVPHVGVGEVFIVAGQSNSANYGEGRTQPKSGLVAAFDGQKWAPADDPQPGASGVRGSIIPALGDALAERFRVPVGFESLGVGSTSVREWMPLDTAMAEPPTTGGHVLAVEGGKMVSTGELFDRLAAALRHFPTHGVRAVLWHQGESDSNQGEGHRIRPEDYAADLRGLIAASRREAGWNVPWVVAQASYHGPADLGNEALRAAQHSVVDGTLTLAGPDTDSLGPAYREHEGSGVHMNAIGLARHGQLWAAIIGDWLDKGGVLGIDGALPSPK